LPIGLAPGTDNVNSALNDVFPGLPSSALPTSFQDHSRQPADPPISVVLPALTMTGQCGLRGEVKNHVLVVDLLAGLARRLTTLAREVFRALRQDYAAITT
jgi:hypothetical protein